MVCYAMKFKVLNIILGLIIMLFLFSSCDKKKETIWSNATEVFNQEVFNAIDKKEDNLEVKNMSDSGILNFRKPNETGKIMVVIFHKFVDTIAPKNKDDQFTTTFKDFETLLGRLNDMGYRLISLNDFIDNNISVPRGFIPIVFTFDDGTADEFSLVRNHIQLQVKSNTAVGVMEKFYLKHPDFGLKGTFYVNLGLKTFEGSGTLSERLKFLIDKGFEIGNHTLNHINLQNISEENKIIMEIGANQKRMYELIPGYTMNTFSIPYGLAPLETEYRSLIKGEYKGVKYKNKAIMKDASLPMYSPIDKEFDPMKVKRVLSKGMKPEEGDLDWWLERMTLEEQYVSDGNPDAVTVPLECLSKVDLGKLKGKRLILD